MAAFEHAVSLGYRHLETDVHLSADGVLMAFHDPDLRRTCGVDARIADLSARELGHLRVGGTEPIPTMIDLLRRWPDRRFNIDCKADDALVPLIELVRAEDLLDRVCLGSFSLRRLRVMRAALGPRLLTAMSPSEIVALRLASRVPGAALRAAQVPPTTRGRTLVDERFLRGARRVGVPVHVWTIDDAEEMHRLFDLGVDGIMTDDVALLRQVMEDRGLWRG